MSDDLSSRLAEHVTLTGRETPFPQGSKQKKGHFGQESDPLAAHRVPPRGSERSSEQYRLPLFQLNREALFRLCDLDSIFSGQPPESKNKTSVVSPTFFFNWAAVYGPVAESAYQTFPAVSPISFLMSVVTKDLPGESRINPQMPATRSGSALGIRALSPRAVVGLRPGRVTLPLVPG